MNMQEVYDNLCVYDPRHPDYEELKDSIIINDGDEISPPRNGCFCDNCFEGRDPLALEIIRLTDTD